MNGEWIIRPLLLFFLLASINIAMAQEEDLLSLLEEEATTEIVTSIFKTNRVIHGHSIESTAAGVLDVKISHRFGTLNQGFFELWGLDNAMIRIGVDYGISDRFTIGMGRSSFQKVYDGFAKYKFLRQSTGKRTMPLSAAFLADIEVMGTQSNPDPEDRNSSRFAYTLQLLTARKFSDRFSLQLMPTFVHRNLVDVDEENDVFSLGIAARQKVSKRVALTVEYYYVPGNQLPDDSLNEFHNSLAIGVDIETGGHVFQLHLSNSTAMVYRGFITETTGRWADGDIHFGFNISRVFTLKKPNN